MNQVKGYNTDHNTPPPLLLYTLHWLRNLPTNGCGFVWMHENFLHTFLWDLSEAMRVVGCINNVRKKQAYIFTALQVSVSPRRDTIGHQQLGEWTGRQESMRASVASTLLQVCRYSILYVTNITLCLVSCKPYRQLGHPDYVPSAAYKLAKGRGDQRGQRYHRLRGLDRHFREKSRSRHKSRSRWSSRAREKETPVALLSIAEARVTREQGVQTEENLIKQVQTLEETRSLGARHPQRMLAT